ncbi:extracellular solute-binding protein [Streptomyces sp. SP17KL33]|uniref:extracellular solute-binding protein n=1 Tax=Streptomyces sp. SP17KL33 TaxID=3002534 RepID=UPI002E79DA6C|nr:extracellular solute-binding protein [Streptomyces sp. SP17KL33]MEE1832495.1 extracellular solute-binding protein [Streptomyces sp. SP17KL33]
MNRHLVGTAAGLTLALALTGCGKGSSSGTDDSDGRTITFVAAKYDDDTQPFWENLIDDFEARNPGYKVNLEVVDWEQMDSKVKTYIQTKQQPDVLNYNKFSDFARDDLIYKADEAVSAKVLDDFLPLFADQATYEGVQYGLPFISSARLFFYNKEIFGKAGVTAPPKSWAEVEAVARKIKKTGAIPLGLPLGPEEAQGEFGIWSMNNGGGWVDDSGKWAVDQPANVETLTYLRKLTRQGLTQPNPETTNRKDVFNQFAQGRIGMLNGAVFMRKGFIDPVDKNLDYGVAPLPSKDGTTHNTLGVQDYLVAFKKDGGKNREAVNKFLDFFYQKENASRFLSTEGFLSVTKSAGDALSSDADYYKPFVDALSGAKFAPADNPGWAAVDGAVKQQIGTAVADGDPQEVLKKIQKTAQKAG